MTSEHLPQPSAAEKQPMYIYDQRQNLVGAKALLDFYESENDEQKNQRRLDEEKRKRDLEDDSALSHVPTYEINGATWAFIAMPSRQNRN